MTRHELLGTAVSRTSLAFVGGLIVGFAGAAAWLRFGGPRLPAGTDAVIDQVAESDLARRHGHHRRDGCERHPHLVRVDPPDGPGTRRRNALHRPRGRAIFWPPAFLRELSCEGYRVIRFDQRGTGASDWMPGWSREHPYTLVDMARDAIAVLDATGTERARLIGSRSVGWSPRRWRY